MAKQEAILDLKVEQGDAIAELDRTKKSIIQLKEEQNKLTKAYKDGNVTIEEYASESVRLEQILKKETKTYNDVTKSVQGTTGSFDKLKDAISNTIPGFGAISNGFKAATKSALAFIATPIGAVIGALGVAIGALTAFFKGSEEGQTQWNKVMNIGGAIMGKVTDAVQLLGKYIFDNLVKGFQLVGDFLGRLIPGFNGLVDSIQKFLNLDTASTISNLEEQEIALKRLLIVERERLKRQIEEAKLRAESTKDLKDRRAALLEVEETTNKLYDQEIKLARIQDEILKHKATLANNTIEDNDALAESTARLETLEAERNSRLKENATKLLAISEQEKAIKQKAHDEELKRIQEESDARTALLEQKRKDAHEEFLIEKKKRDDIAALEKANIDRLHNLQKTFHANTKKLDEQENERIKLNERFKQDLRQETFTQTSRLLAEFGASQRGLALASLAADTAAAIGHITEQAESAKSKADKAAIYTAGFARIAANMAQAYRLIKGSAPSVNAASGGQIITTSTGQQFVIEGGKPVPIEKAKTPGALGEELGGLAGSTASGAAIGSTFGPVGTVVGAAVGFVGGLFRNIFNKKKAFSSGGYTGPGGEYEPAGVVHAGEVVWSQRDVAAVGGPTVANSMRPTFKGYHDGGLVTRGLSPDNGILAAIRAMPNPVVSIREIVKEQRKVLIKEILSGNAGNARKSITGLRANISKALRP